MTAFQTSVTVQPAPAVAGDFASSNPRHSFDAGPGGLIAAAAGLIVGRAAWVGGDLLDANSAGQVAANTGFGSIAGFVHREQQGVLSAFLAESSLVIPGGYAVSILTGGDLWVKNDGSGQATVGMKAYANYADGKITFAATGSATGATCASSSIAASTSSFTGSISGNVLTVTAVGSGSVVPGTTISGTSVATGTKILSQLSGTANGVGTYAVDIPEQTVASTTISGTYGTLTLGAAPSATFGVGDTLSGTNVVAGTKITKLLTGTGGSGSTYAVDNNTVVSSTTITAALNVETKWFATSAGAAGELVKISSHALG